MKRILETISFKEAKIRCIINTTSPTYAPSWNLKGKQTPTDQHDYSNSFSSEHNWNRTIYLFYLAMLNKQLNIISPLPRNSIPILRFMDHAIVIVITSYIHFDILGIYFYFPILFQYEVEYSTAMNYIAFT